MKTLQNYIIEKILISKDTVHTDYTDYTKLFNLIKTILIHNAIDFKEGDHELEEIENWLKEKKLQFNRLGNVYYDPRSAADTANKYIKKENPEVKGIGSAYDTTLPFLFKTDKKVFETDANYFYLKNKKTCISFNRDRNCVFIWMASNWNDISYYIVLK